jgi:hypothetical protein
LPAAIAVSTFLTAERMRVERLWLMLARLALWTALFLEDLILAMVQPLLRNDLRVDGRAGL